MYRYDVAVIGAGPAGLICARNAARKGFSVLLVDSHEHPGVKLAVAGGGRGNFTNRTLTERHYVTGDPSLVRAVLRAFHFYADNDRVPQQVAALRGGDFDAFLQLVTASGDSSWEYLQNVIPAGYKEHQEMGVTIAAAKHYLQGKGAVRVHGGGFAGTAQAFVPVDMLADFKAHMEAILGEGRCHVLSIRPEGGAVL